MKVSTLADVCCGKRREKGQERWQEIAGDVVPEDFSRLPPRLTTDRQSMDVIFYDPFSSVVSGGNSARQGDLRVISEGSRSLNPEKKCKGGRDASRTNALEAVARDLAMLSLRKPG